MWSELEFVDEEVRHEEASIPPKSNLRACNLHARSMQDAQTTLHTLAGQLMEP